MHSLFLRAISKQFQSSFSLREKEQVENVFPFYSLKNCGKMSDITDLCLYRAHPNNRGLKYNIIIDINVTF